MAESGGKQSRILIADDIPKNIQIVANILQEEGYQMAFAQNGQAALKQARTNTYDLILLDIMMPEMDGFEVCRELKRGSSTKDIPVIFLTAKTDIESTVKGLEMGAVDYVTKPFNGTELLARVKTHLELKHSREELKELNAAKDKFFSIIAHDLKNPLGAFKNITELLSESFNQASHERKQSLIKKMKRSATHLYDLLENLLQWARSQTGKISFTPEKTDLYTLVNNALFVHTMNAEKKNIQLTSDISRDTCVYVDRSMIDTVFRNLITNAIKFTPEGGAVRVFSRDDGAFIEVAVEDTGVGIAEAYVPNLFRIDVHCSTLGTAQEKGTGLGLILCKEFIERNKGSIRVESREGEGTTFLITIPKE